MNIIRVCNNSKIIEGVMMIVKTKRIYDGVSSTDGKRILVDRLWPRGIKKDETRIEEWLKDVAPSSALRQWFAHDTSKWAEFKRQYFRELKEKKELLSGLKKQAAGQTITFLFSAKDPEHNNAVALKEFFKK
ncbi:MAG: DUF488 domain-containing protein [Smithella sp.]